jgi:hypothetical protein
MCVFSRFLSPPPVLIRGGSRAGSAPHRHPASAENSLTAAQRKRVTEYSMFSE